jgi:hypothetical protein
VCLSEQAHLVEHVAIYGGTGRGKSKFLELLLRQLLEQGRGFCLLDPHGDLAKEMAAFIYMKLAKLPRHLTDNVHFLDPASDRTFSFDPLEYHGDPAHHHRWLEAKVDVTARAILRKQGEIDFRGKARLERWLKSVLYACGVRIATTGRHLPISDALVLLNPKNPYHDSIYKLIAPELPDKYRDNFEKLRQTKHPMDQEAWVESTINWLHSFLSGPVEAILGCERPSLNFRQVIENGGVVLANLAANEDRGFSEEQASAVGALIINEVIATAMNTDRGERAPYYLIVDEANYFMGEDLAKALKRTRKRGLSIWLGFQDIASMKDEHADMTGQVLSQCAVQISFQQKNPADLDILSKFFGDPNLDFTQLFMPVDRPNGYEWTPVDELSEALTLSKNWERSQGTSDAAGEAIGEGDSLAYEENFSANAGEAYSTDAPAIRQLSSRRGDSHSNKRATNSSRTQQNTHTASETASEGGGESRTQSVAHRLIPLAQTREEMQDQGRLANATDVQYAKIRNILRTLAKATAMISIQHHESFPFRVHEVIDILERNHLFPKEVVVEDLKRFIYQRHPCYFQADVTVAAEHARLQRFLRPSPLLAEASKRQLIDREAPPPLSLDEPSDTSFGI